MNCLDKDESRITSAVETVLVILGLFLLSLILRLIILSRFDFDGLYGQDAYAYYNFALELHNGQALSPFFWPWGYPLLLMLGFTVFGAHAAVGQAINIILGAALSPLIYLLARQMRAGRLSAMVAALLMAICGQALQSSIVLMSDIPALFWALLSAVCLWRYVHRGQSRWLALAALLLAFAGITRWLYLILTLPWTAVVLINWSGRFRWRDVFIAAGCAGCVLLPQLFVKRASPYPVLQHEWIVNWSPIHAIQHEFTNIDGHFNYADINALYYARPAFDPIYLAPVFTLLALLGLWVWHRRFAQAIFLLGWILLPYLFLIGIPYQNIRFPLILFPPITLCVGVGLDAAATWLTPRLRWLALVGIISVGIGQSYSAGWPLVNAFIINQQRDREIAAWAAEQIPTDGTLYTMGPTLAIRYLAPQLNVREIYNETPATLEASWEPGHSDYLLLNVWEINHQWAGRDPQTAALWLQQTRGLTKIGQQGNYTLYRIRG